MVEELSGIMHTRRIRLRRECPLFSSKSYPLPLAEKSQGPPPSSPPSYPFSPEVHMTEAMETSEKIKGSAGQLKGGSPELSSRGIRDKKEQEEVVSVAHAGFGDSKKSKALRDHLRFDKTEEKIAVRVWWPSISKDVSNSTEACDTANAELPIFKEDQNNFALSK
ncbi:hypothetical protein PoB_004141700 [Plakobranchus ocellatus]|uniref:Integrase zinc-binding domain-containing protein n=1 Tax=Plakobranchus ocellatus TaxID=259542 RepID=A0AAV4B737_9GAST|nr:hypothetical protein PoB_004141700 [Plakobranchus ocellatus]